MEHRNIYAQTTNGAGRLQEKERNATVVQTRSKHETGHDNKAVKVILTMRDDKGAIKLRLSTETAERLTAE